MLVRFREAVEGIGSIRGPEIKEGREPLYRWTGSSRGGVSRVYELLRPWLSGPKLAEFDAALSGEPSLLAAGAAPERSVTLAESCAWAAGLFDGEGWTGLTKHRSHEGFFALEAAVTQSSSDGAPEVLCRFQQLVGVGTITGPILQKDAVRPVYRWKTYGIVKIESVLALLLPWLSRPKREQARLALDAMHAQPTLPRGNPAWGSHKTHCVHGHGYAAARTRPYKSRRGGAQRRDSKQCLRCSREQARARGAALRERKAF